MPFKDLREFISKLEAVGQAQKIQEQVDWYLEAGAMVRLAGEKHLPAPFFQAIKGYPSGYRLIGGLLSDYKRIAIAMDMEPGTPVGVLIEEYLRRKERPIRPVVTQDAPCKENIHVNKEVNLLEFPIPLIHQNDGGRYLGTWHITISKDDQSDWVNWGMYRHMLHDQKTVGILLTSRRKHLWTIYSKRGQPRTAPMEVAIVIGVEPISTLCAGTPTEVGVSEADIAGGLRGEPIELVKCETVDLMVPATAEIVIEGEFMAEKLVDEGPFGEYPGYASSAKGSRPVIKVKAITHRDNPILTMSCLGIPLDDNLIWCMAKSAMFLQALRQRGLPVVAVNSAPECSSLLTIVGLAECYPGVAADVAHLLWGIDSAHATPYIAVVERDIDPYDISQVLHAIVTKCHPVTGLRRVEDVPVTPLLPFLSPTERQHQKGAMVCFDCTWPQWNEADIPKRISFSDSYPVEIQKKALKKWSKHGFSFSEK